MDFSEIVVAYDFTPIAVSDDSSEDYVFRVEILKHTSSQQEFGVRVFRREAFRLSTLNEKRKHQIKTVTFEDVTLDWRLIKAASTENAFSRIMEEVEYTFPFLSEKGVIMPEYNEVVKIIDLEPISVPEKNLYYRFRVEIIKKNDSQGCFRAQVYRFERFELQPAYPIIDGKPKYDQAAPVILIEDESIIFKDIENETIDGLIQEVLQVVDRLKARSMEDEIDLPQQV